MYVPTICDGITCIVHRDRFGGVLTCEHHFLLASAPLLACVTACLSFQQQRRITISSPHSCESGETSPVSAQVEDSSRHSGEQHSNGWVSKPGRRSIQLPKKFLQVVLDQEYIRATRELASQPRASLIALSKARQEMDTMAQKMQVMYC